ncbi:MAG TPA: DUF6152 family protein [Candidatus Acidoferrum sp.]|nr:DUF6152 family protein [Candidatus Acidoferrum sp.]
MKQPGSKQLLAGALATTLLTPLAHAHHSFAMYDSNKIYVMTGIVTRLDPNPNHLQVFVAPLNNERTEVLKDDKGEPVVWAIEMRSAGEEARHGITVNAFPRGSIVSIGFHPLRNGFPGGGRGKNGFFKCPDDTPPAAGKHCDSVPGSKLYGEGGLTPTEPMPKQAAPKP